MSKIIPLSKRSAFMRPVFDEFDGLFNKFFGEHFFDSEQNKTSFPKFNIYEKEDRFTVEALVGDIPKDKIKVSLKGCMLTIQGESNQDKEVNEDSYYVREISKRAFSRSLKLPDKIYIGGMDEVRPTTSLKDGILKVSFKYVEEEEPQEVDKIIEID